MELGTGGNVELHTRWRGKFAAGKPPGEPNTVVERQLGHRFHDPEAPRESDGLARVPGWVVATAGRHELVRPAHSYAQLGGSVPACAPHRPADIFVLLDASGSMAGTKLGAAVAAARELYRGLASEDRFWLGSFGAGGLHVGAGSQEPALGPNAPQQLEGPRWTWDSLETRLSSIMEAGRTAAGIAPRSYDRNRTALYDAVGAALSAAKAAASEGQAVRLVAVTDGEENASQTERLAGLRARLADPGVADFRFVAAVAGGGLGGYPAGRARWLEQVRHAWAGQLDRRPHVII